MSDNITVDELKLYHECGHTILAKLFEDYLELEGVTLSPGKVLEGNALEGTGAGTNIKLKRFNSEGQDAFAIMLLAGFVGQNIFLRGREHILMMRQEFVNNPDKFTKDFCSGDWQLFQFEAAGNALARKIDTVEYLRFCLRFLVDFLCDEKIWKIVEKLAIKIKSQTDLTLKKDQLGLFFKSTGLNDYLNEIKPALFSTLGFSL